MVRVAPTASTPSATATALPSNLPVSGRSSRIARAWRRDKHLYALFALPVVYFAVFQYAPMYGVILAFKDYSVSRGILGSPWIGLQNFREFFNDPYSWILVRNTFLINIYQIVFGFPIPILLAILFNELRSERFRRVSQTVSYLPHFIAPVVVAGMITSFLATAGIINQLIDLLGGNPKLWLLDPHWFRTIIVSSDIWQSTGWSAIIYLAAIAAIDRDLYEAAYVDGANRWQRIIGITLPSLVPTITILFLLRLGAMLTLDYQKILLLYSGVTRQTGDVLGTYIYRRGLEGSDFSYAATVGLIQALVGLAFVASSNAIARRLSDSSLW